MCHDAKGLFSKCHVNKGLFDDLMKCPSVKCHLTKCVSFVLVDAL